MSNVVFNIPQVGTTTTGGIITRYKRKIILSLIHKKKMYASFQIDLCCNYQNYASSYLEKFYISIREKQQPKAHYSIRCH